MSDSVILFGSREAGIYLLSEIYNPDIHGTDVSASGKIVPAVGSQIVDDTSGLKNTLYTVISVNEITLKSTLIATAVSANISVDIDRTLLYGNDVYMLYYAPVNMIINGQTVTLTKLVVDNKFSVFGNHAAKYKLLRTNNLGQTEVISLDYTTTGELGELSGIYNGTVVDMIESSVYPGIRKCNGCFTNYTLQNNDLITCDIYDAAGMSIATLKLVAKEASFLNEQDGASDPIISFDVTGNQFDISDNKLFLYNGQNISELVIYPKLTYGNSGSVLLVSIDDISGFVYGLEDINTSIPGIEYPITIKYYINEDVISPIAFGEGDSRYLTKTIYVKIINSIPFNINKVTVSPVWNSTTNKWLLYHRGYRVDRAYTSGPVVSGINVAGFNGGLFNTEQLVTLSATTTSPQGITGTFEQKIKIELKNYNSVVDRTRWLMRDDGQPVTNTYGDNTSGYIRPLIRYSTEQNRYYIPDTIFIATSNMTAQEVFLQNFYWKNNPPTIVGETVAPVPTHFSIINPRTNTNITVGLRKPISQWNLNFELVQPITDGQYRGDTLLVEWYVLIGGTYHFIFGSPVDVEQ